ALSSEPAGVHSRQELVTWALPLASILTNMERNEEDPFGTGVGGGGGVTSETRFTLHVRSLDVQRIACSSCVRAGSVSSTVPDAPFGPTRPWKWMALSKEVLS
ncbi:MAG: hypothetical protein M3O84_08920, partial [Actinomycetota bacterium]|nr:hypothetical protein [Actinomycetota bacterium]